jgi:hypothetical protein
LRPFWCVLQRDDMCEAHIIYIPRLHVSTSPRLPVSPSPRLHVCSLPRLHVSTSRRLHVSTSARLHVSTSFSSLLFFHFICASILLQYMCAECREREGRSVDDVEGKNRTQPHGNVAMRGGRKELFSMYGLREVLCPARCGDTRGHCNPQRSSKTAPGTPPSAQAAKGKLRLSLASPPTPGTSSTGVG